MARSFARPEPGSARPISLRQNVLAEPEEEAAHVAGLRYVHDTMSGIRRKRAGRSFTYLDPSGERISERYEIERIHTLAIPPAWTDVWICPNSNGHLQATGRDAKGRKQYRYHPR